MDDIHFDTEALDRELEQARRHRVRVKLWRYKRARQLRREIFKILGGRRCAICGRINHPQFDHPQGRSWDPSRVEYVTRLRRYLREAKAGLLRVLCIKCNGKDGRDRQIRRSFENAVLDAIDEEREG